MRQSKLLKLFLTVGVSIAFFTNCVAGKNDTSVINHELIVAMTAYRVPVVGYAIIKDYKLLYERLQQDLPKFAITIKNQTKGHRKGQGRVIDRNQQ